MDDNKQIFNEESDVAIATMSDKNIENLRLQHFYERINFFSHLWIIVK